MKSNSVLIIGSNGYIGSRLVHDLKGQYLIHGCDRLPFTERFTSYLKDYDEMYISDLLKYDTIILVAADSSVKACQESFTDSYINNVHKFIRLLDKLVVIKRVHKHNIKFIYASSSSVYGTGAYNQVETYRLEPPLNNYDATKQLGDIIALRYINDIELYGLRFGTVNGWSPNIRWDLMINSMVKSAKETGIINVYNGRLERPILAITDLVCAVKRILEHDEWGTDNRRGIYNLCSFNSSIGRIARQTYDQCKLEFDHEIALNDHPDSTTHNGNIIYDFSIDITKFKTSFDWRAKCSIGDIVRGLSITPIHIPFLS